MAENTLYYFKTKPSVTEAFTADKTTPTDRLEPATCQEAESFALRVLDDSMQPEFRKGCIIVIDPTGRATHGSYVLANDDDSGYIFRQLCQRDEGWVLTALNDQYPSEPAMDNLDAIAGVIVQRAGVRRSYHKHYE